MRVDLPTPECVLAIGAHPDDVEFGCGATLAKWGEAGTNVHLLVCTDGSKGSWDPHVDRDELVQRRQAEQVTAAQRLHPQATAHFLDAVDGELTNTVERRGHLARIIRLVKPDVVLGHDPWRRWRMHPDHRAAGLLTVDAVVAARDPHYHPEHRSDGLGPHRPTSLLLFECEQPDLVEQFSDHHLTAKIDALLAHQSQLESTMGIAADETRERIEFEQRMRDQARNQGRLAGVPLGEAFRWMDPAR